MVFLIADLAGYTALTEAMGDMEAAKVIARYVDLVDGVLRPGTRMLERVGDEVLIVGDEAATTPRGDLLPPSSVSPCFPRCAPEFMRGACSSRVASISTRC